MGVRRLLVQIRDTLAGEPRIRVRPPVYVGYDEASEARWLERFAHTRRLPDVALFRAAFDPAALTADEAQAETGVKLAYAWGSAAAFGRRMSSGIPQAVALCCEITVWSRSEQRMLLRKLFAGTPPPDSVLSTPRRCTDEVFGGMPPLGEIVEFLKRMRVEPSVK